MNKKAIGYKQSALSRRPGLTSLRGRPGSRRAFTLTELLIAIAILIVVIIAASRIFATASQVTGIGQATSDVLTEAAAIDRNLRSDIEQMSYEGVLAIRNVSVTNDINGASLLLNPELPAGALLRCDQLVFFATGVEGAQSPRVVASGATTKGQGTEAYIYYGHTYQLPGAKPFQQSNVEHGLAYDVAPTATAFPWTTGSINMATTVFGIHGTTGGPSGTGQYASGGAGSMQIAQPGARQWLLARNVAILGDDDGGNSNVNQKAVYLDSVVTARSVFLNNAGLPNLGPSFLSMQLRDGRVDGAATRISDVRKRILFAGTNWQTQQRPYILNNLVYYPRAERTAPSNHRVDQALTNHVLSSSCSSITIEWTYDLGVGEATLITNPVLGTTFTYNGVSNAGTNTPSAAYEPVGEIRWFGLPDNTRGVFPYSYSGPQWPDGWTGQAQTIDPNNIEQFASVTGNYREVNYVFGFNQDRPFWRNMGNSIFRADASQGSLNTLAAYTPWPSALRITMVLHDPAAKLEGGRTYQFILRLPKREQ